MNTNIQQIVNKSNSFSAIIRNLNISETSQTGRKNLKQRMKEDSICLIQYFKNREINHPFNSSSKRMVSNDEYFVKGTKRLCGKSIKKRLKKMGWIVICKECNQNEIHNNKPLTLNIDHIDGDPTNNLLSNLAFLCPNCHSQTSTFAGRNKKKSNDPIYSPKLEPKLEPKLFFLQMRSFNL